MEGGGRGRGGRGGDEGGRRRYGGGDGGTEEDYGHEMPRMIFPLQVVLRREHKIRLLHRHWLSLFASRNP